MLFILINQHLLISFKQKITLFPQINIMSSQTIFATKKIYEPILKEVKKVKQIIIQNNLPLIPSLPPPNLSSRLTISK